MPVVDIRKNRPAFIDRRAAADLYCKTSDAANLVDLDLTSGVNARGATFVGVFSEDRARYQITVTEDGETIRTRDFMPVEGFDRFAPEGKAVTKFFDQFKDDLIEYTKLDRIARERTRDEVSMSVTGYHQVG